MLPVLVDPELKDSHPLVPPTPAFAFETDTLPELVPVPTPLPRLSVPPDSTVLRPALAWNKPPEALVPLPTEIKTIPATPRLVDPEPKLNVPVFPSPLVPAEKTNAPLVPS